MRISSALAAGTLALAIAPTALPDTGPPTPVHFQTISALAAAEATSSFTSWLRKETRNSVSHPCGATPRRVLYALAAGARQDANDAWLLGELVRTGGGNPGQYITRAKLLSRQAARTTVTLRKCGKAG